VKKDFINFFLDVLEIKNQISQKRTRVPSPAQWFSNSALFQLGPSFSQLSLFSAQPFFQLRPFRKALRGGFRMGGFGEGLCKKFSSTEFRVSFFFFF
jgi:hypothetical protein